MAQFLKLTLPASEQDRPGLQSAENQAPDRSPNVLDVQVENVRIGPEQRLVFYTAPSTPGADRIRYIRMHLRSMQESRGLKTVLITSPIEGDGKTTLALNLATALAEDGKRRVLLLESDLHHASVAARLGLSDTAEGLAECLDKGVNPFSVMRRLDPLGWYLLPAGPVRQNATELLHTLSYPALLKAVSGYFDWILIDSPPVIAVSDAVFLRQHADATLLVVRAGHTPQATVDESVRQLGRQNIAAILLNAADGLDRVYYKYGSKYYRPKAAAEAKSD